MTSIFRRTQLYTGVSHIPSALQNLDTKPVRTRIFDQS